MCVNWSVYIPSHVHPFQLFLSLI